jgi:hypothetical protein
VYVYETTNWNYEAYSAAEENFPVTTNIGSDGVHISGDGLVIGAATPLYSGVGETWRKKEKACSCC